MLSVMFQPSPQLYPFRSRYFQSSAGRVHYVDEGRGQPVLFLHGNPTWSFLYRQLIDRLRHRYRCIAPDYPGFGLSDHPSGYGYGVAEHAAVISELVDELRLPELAIMGHDWGGPIGLWVAFQRPERISHLILFNTTYRELGHPWLQVFSLIMSSPPLQWAIRRRNLFVEVVMPLGMRVRLGPVEMDHYRKVLPTPESRAGVAELPGQFRRARGWVESWASQVTRELGDVPLLLAWGLKDRVFRPRFRRVFLEDFGHVVRLDLPQAGHFVPEDAPAALAGAMEDFLG